MKKYFSSIVPVVSVFLVASACVAFELGMDPLEQKFKKVTVEYRDFQGQNKKAYKLEEVTKNEAGLITAHNFYDESGNLLNGSYSVMYDNNGNIKEKKYSAYSAAVGKVTHQRIVYNNVFEKGKIKQAILTDKENPDRVDTITYVRDASGVIVLKRTRMGDITKITNLNASGKPERENELLKGKLEVKRTFTYGANGITQIIGVNPQGEEIQNYAYVYNEKGKLIKQDRTYKGLDVDFHATYKYNPAGQLIVEERTDSGNKNVIVYEYLANGLLDKVSVKNEKNIRNNERVYTYE